VHDIADLEQRGVPSAFVATVKFIDGAAAQASALGADTAAVFVEHPIQDRTDDEMRTVADSVVDEILALLVDAGGD
jgi:hypothetical protein